MRAGTRRLFHDRRRSRSMEAMAPPRACPAARPSMRQIATLPQDSASKFANYLQSLRIDTRLEAQPDGVAVWGCDEDKVGQARQELEAFSRDPAAPRFVPPLPSAARPEEARERDQPREPARAEVEEEEEEEADAGGERPVTIALIAIS